MNKLRDCLVWTALIVGLVVWSYGCSTDAASEEGGRLELADNCGRYEILVFGHRECLGCEQDKKYFEGKYTNFVVYDYAIPEHRPEFERWGVTSFPVYIVREQYYEHNAPANRTIKRVRTVLKTRAVKNVLKYGCARKPQADLPATVKPVHDRGRHGRGGHRGYYGHPYGYGGYCPHDPYYGYYPRPYYNPYYSPYGYGYSDRDGFYYYWSH